MLIKICGLRDTETAKKAVLAGIQYIGLLFSKISPRAIDLNMAYSITQIVRGNGGDVVGVFVDESLTEIDYITEYLSLKIVQLHSDKVRALVNKLAPKFQIIYVADGKKLPPILNSTKDFIMFERLPINNTKFRYFIAGGLNSQNVIKRIEEDKPYAIDVSSSVESKPGIKDINKILEFIQAACPTYIGRFGGQYAPESLIAPLKGLENAYFSIAKTASFR